MTTINVWPALGTTVTLASSYVITAAGAAAELTKEIADLLRDRRLLTRDPTAANPNPSPIPPTTSGEGLVFETLAAMLAYSVTTPNQPATLLGYHSAGDGGGGDFVFYFGSTTTADGGTVFSTVNGNGRWKRVLEEKNYRNVKWFGARGIDDTLGAYLGRDPTLSGPDDTDAIEAAWLSLAGAWGAELHFPSGNYKITRTLRFGTGSGGPVGNLRLSGINSQPGQVPGSSLLWYGPAENQDEFSVPLIDFPEGATCPAFSGSIMAQFTGYAQRVENLAFSPAPGMHVGCVINLGNDLGDVVSGSNQIKFFNCQIAGGSPHNPLSGTADWVIAADIWRNPEDQNLEDCGFVDCNIGGALNGIVWFCPTTQPYGWTFLRCYLSNFQMGPGGSDEPYGVGFWHNQDSISLTVQDCDIQRIACHHMLNKLPKSMKLANNHAEVFKKIIYAVWSGGNDNNHIHIDSGRYSPDHTGQASYGPYTSWDASNHETIRITGDMGLLITNTNFAQYSEEAFSICMNGGTLTSINSGYPNMTPFQRAPNYNPYSEARPGRTYSTGDVGNVGGVVTLMPKLDGCINGAGQVTISGTDTFVDVDSSSTPAWRNEPNTDASANVIAQTYKVRLTVQGVTGTPTVTAPYVSNLAYDGFRINLPSAPGGGNSITIAYEPYRV